MSRHKQGTYSYAEPRTVTTDAVPRGGSFWWPLLVPGSGCGSGASRSRGGFVLAQKKTTQKH